MQGCISSGICQAVVVGIGALIIANQNQPPVVGLGHNQPDGIPNPGPDIPNGGAGGPNEPFGKALVAGTVVATFQGALGSDGSVRGNPQVTSGFDGARHALLSVQNAARIVDQIGANNVSSVDFNRPLSGIFPGVSSNMRADVVVVSKDGIVYVVEVTSRSQTSAMTRNKLDTIREMLGDRRVIGREDSTLKGGSLPTWGVGSSGSGGGSASVATKGGGGDFWSALGKATGWW